MEPYITEALVRAGIELGTLTFKGTTTLVNSKIQSLRKNITPINYEILMMRL